MMKTQKWQLIVAVAALAWSTGQLASAAIITEPSGLNPGDQYRLIFVTSGTTQATNTTAAYYNNFVNNAANAVPELAALGVNWKVLGNLNGIDPQTNTGTGGADLISTYRLDGELFAASYPALWGSAAARGNTVVLIDELGGQVINNPQEVGRVWTGMGEALSVPNWSAGGYIGNGGAGGNTGAGRADNAWYTYGWYGLSNTQSQHLYALSDVITVAAPVPEPSSLLLFMLGAAGLLVFRWRRRRVQ